MRTSAVRPASGSIRPASEQGTASPALRAKGKAAAAIPGLERRVAYRFAILANLSAKALARIYTRRFGLSLADWKALAIVGHYEPIHPGAIAERTSMVPERVSRALDRLVTKEVIERSPDEGDRRRVVVTLSGKGRKVFAEIEAERAVLEEDLLAALSATERRTLFSILDKLDARAQATLIRPVGRERRATGTETAG